jgi:hypothetical protein
MEHVWEISCSCKHIYSVSLLNNLHADHKLIAEVLNEQQTSHRIIGRIQGLVFSWMEIFITDQVGEYSSRRYR